MLSALAGSLLSLAGLAGCDRFLEPRSPPNPPPTPAPPTLAVPARGAYTGAYIAFGDREDAVSLEGIEEFEAMVGKHQAIVAFSSFWGERRFPVEEAAVIAKHGAAPLIFWSPWDWPYREEDTELHGPDQYSLESILRGRWDRYIDRWADQAKALHTPLLVSLCNEMNGDWFPWGGTYYGGGRPIAGSQPPRFVGPEYFKRAYRYVVDRVRARGAGNISWVFHANNFSEPYADWNNLAQYYPGAEYVDWLGVSAYGQMYPDDPKWEDFDSMLEQAYRELAKLDPAKPMLVAEWGVGEFPLRGNKAAWITEAADEMRTDFPRVRAAVYWHERWQNNKKMLFSDLRVNSSPAALEAYRRAIADPFWIGVPVCR